MSQLTILKLQVGKVFVVRGPHGPHNPRQILSSQSSSPCIPLSRGQRGQTSSLAYPALWAPGPGKTVTSYFLGMEMVPAPLSPVHIVFGPWGHVTLQEHLRGHVAEGTPQSRPLNVLHSG